MKKEQELVLSTNDLNDVGINTQLSSNDLIEVIATDLYEKVQESIKAANAQHTKIIKDVQKVVEDEKEKFRQVLIKKGLVSKDDSFPIYVEQRYIDFEYISVDFIHVEEKTKGDSLCLQTDATRLPKNFTGTTKLDLSAKISNKIVNKKTVSGIEVEETQISELNCTTTSQIQNKAYQPFKKIIEDHNKDIKELYQSLPKRSFSVDSFIREARTKLNKKIISGQSAEFKQKMSQLFKITV